MKKLTVTLSFTDNKQYGQYVGRRISKETNVLPDQAGIIVNKYWFWISNMHSIAVESSRIILLIEEGEPEVAIAEFCVYNEKNQ